MVQLVALCHTVNTFLAFGSFLLIPLITTSRQGFFSHNFSSVVVEPTVRNRHSNYRDNQVPKRLTP
jgi:hypothetical protein